MNWKKRIGGALVFAALLIAGVLVSLPASSSPCYGLRYDYYASSALQTIVGTKVSCPGFPNQYDTDVNGNYTETPWYTTETVNCPCPSGSGGGTGGGDPYESEPE